MKKKNLTLHWLKQKGLGKKKLDGRKEVMIRRVSSHPLRRFTKTTEFVRVAKIITIQNFALIVWRSFYSNTSNLIIFGNVSKAVVFVKLPFDSPLALSLFFSLRHTPLVQPSFFFLRRIPPLRHLRTGVPWGWDFF